jgi:hypothetical protein
MGGFKAPNSPSIGAGHASEFDTLGGRIARRLGAVEVPRGQLLLRAGRLRGLPR